MLRFFTVLIFYGQGEEPELGTHLKKRMGNEARGKDTFPTFSESCVSTRWSVCLQILRTSGTFPLHLCALKQAYGARSFHSAEGPVQAAMPFLSPA